MTAKIFHGTPFGSLPSQLSLGKPAAAFPGRVAGDSDLIIAVDRQQTTLAAPMASGDLSITVADASSIGAYNLLSIDNEILKTTGPGVSNVVPVSRGFDGTTPAQHLVGATVAGFVDAFHHNGLVAEIEAIENALGANLSKLPTSPFVISGAFNFASQSPGGSLIAGANTITLTPVPAGINGTDVGHYVYISGGTGTAEAALILGGSAVGGNSTGTLIIQCANTHSGAWTIQTATGGIQEAICSLPAAGGYVIVNTNVTLYANVGPCGKTSVIATKLSGLIITGSFTIFGQSPSGDGRAATFCQTGCGTENIIAGNSPYWMTGRTPAYALTGANINNFPFASLNPSQFGCNAVMGAVNVPSGALADGGNGLLGLATTSSTTTCSTGVAAYANMLVDGCRAWGGNFGVSNQTSPSGTTGVHATSLIGLELDCNVFGPGNCDGLVGLQVIGLNTTIQPTNAKAVEIAPLGSGAVGAPRWGQGLVIDTGSCLTGIDIFPYNPGNNSGSHKIQFWSTDTGGTGRQSEISANPDGTLSLAGGNGTPAKGVVIQDGGGNILMNLQPGASSFLNPLPVYANDAAAGAGGLASGTLYKTSTGQVMQKL